MPNGVGESRKFNEAWTNIIAKNRQEQLTLAINHFHYEYNRVPTVRENANCSPFQTFYFGSKTSQNRQVGNAVPVFLSQAIAKNILKYLKSIL